MLTLLLLHQHQCCSFGALQEQQHWLVDSGSSHDTGRCRPQPAAASHNAHLADNPAPAAAGSLEDFAAVGGHAVECSSAIRYEHD